MWNPFRKKWEHVEIEMGETTFRELVFGGSVRFTIHTKNATLTLSQGYFPKLSAVAGILKETDDGNRN